MWTNVLRTQVRRSKFRGPVNIGSDEMVSINDLAKTIVELSNKNQNLNNIDGPTGVRGRNSSNLLIKEKMGWQPSMPLKDGLKTTFNWINSQLEN